MAFRSLAAHITALFSARVTGKEIVFHLIRNPPERLSVSEAVTNKLFQWSKKKEKKKHEPKKLLHTKNPYNSKLYHTQVFRGEMKWYCQWFTISNIYQIHSIFLPAWYFFGLCMCALSHSSSLWTCHSLVLWKRFVVNCDLLLARKRWTGDKMRGGVKDTFKARRSGK